MSPEGQSRPQRQTPPGPQGEDAGWGSCSAPHIITGSVGAGPGSAGEAVGIWAEPPAQCPTSQCPQPPALSSSYWKRPSRPALLLWFPTLPGEHGRPLSSHTVPGTEPGGSGDHSTQRPGSVLCGHWGPGQPLSLLPRTELYGAKDLAFPPGPRVTHAAASGSRAVTSLQRPLALGLPGKPDDAEHTHTTHGAAGGCSQSVGLTHIWGRGSSRNCSME